MVTAENSTVALAGAKMLTYDDYVAMTPSDSGNYELHHGKIVLMASPTPEHQDLVTELCARMRVFASGKKIGKVFSAPLDVLFTPNDTLQPDILFVAADRLHIIGAKKIEGAPDLVVEVLSGSNTAQEQRYKKSMYETHGVREYWLIQLGKRPSVTLYRNSGKVMDVVGIYTQDDEIASEVLPGFRTTVSELQNA